MFGEGGKGMRLGNGLNGFVVYGGGEWGKRKCMGKGVVEEFVKKGFGGFMYD